MADPVYGTRPQLALYGLGPKAVARADGAEQDEALAGASREADGYLRKRYTLPLTAWGTDLSKAVCKLAAWDLITTVVGYAPDDPAGTNAKMRRDEAVAWLIAVAEDEITPTGIVDSSTGTDETAEPSTIAASSDEGRGWGESGW